MPELDLALDDCSRDVRVKAQVAKMKIARPEWVVAWTTGTPLGTALHGIKDAGLDVSVITSNGNSNRDILAHFARYHKDMAAALDHLGRASRFLRRTASQTTSATHSTPKRRGGGPSPAWL